MTLEPAWAGLMVGDALGAPVEFCHEYEIRRAYPEGVDRMLQGFVCVRAVNDARYTRLLPRRKEGR